jgi:hypothetical protein
MCFFSKVNLSLVNTRFSYLLLVFYLFLNNKSNAQSLDLKGSWNVALDGQAQVKKAYLPGTLDDAGIGVKDTTPIKVGIASLAHLSRKVYFVGKAAYSKQVAIPKSWKGKKITLLLERVLWSSTIYVDDVMVPQVEYSLVTPHIHDLSEYLVAGKSHKLTIEIDNNNLYPGINVKSKSYPSVESAEMAHAYTNHTQIKWNGVLGNIRLEAEDENEIKNVRIFRGEEKTSYELSLKSYTPTIPKIVLISKTKKGLKVSESIPESSVENLGDKFIFSLPNSSKWDEFNTNVQSVKIAVTDGAIKDTFNTVVPSRIISQQNGDLMINGSRVFMRGNLECAIFPRTGYPPTKVEDWKVLFRSAKSYGLNHIRFHSWCPPEAAFAAADDLGLYLQVELPNWNLKIGEDDQAWQFLRAEAFRIVNTYGNHPSFLFMSMGNELEGDFDKLNGLVAELKAHDPRRMYTSTTFSFQKQQSGIPQINDDFFVTQWTKKGWVRGQVVFNDEPANFTKDYSKSADTVGIPLISHEIGQYSVYPDFREIKEYTGNLVPKNFMAIKADAEAKGVAKYNDQYLKASGRLAAILYKEEIERALKTKSFDGFQLLQLHDFPGQGTALVGLLNAFWKSKGIIGPKEFNQFCSEVVPLVKLPKPVYGHDEQFTIDVEVANFYKEMKNTSISWRLVDKLGKVLKSGKFSNVDMPIGNAIHAGRIDFKFNNNKSDQYTLEVGVVGTKYVNKWNVWVHKPEGVTVPKNDNFVYTDNIAEAMQALDLGRNVLLTPPADTLKGIKTKFVPVFWSPVHFPDNPGTMGLLIKNKHQSFANFPTDYHSDWQWRDLMVGAKAVNVASLNDAGVLVRSIDNFVSNEQLSPLFEAKVGKGKLLFASFNWNKNKDANVLFQSLTKYINSIAFNPTAVLETEKLQGMFK